MTMEPLFLTPLIKSQSINEAINKCKVGEPFSSVTNYSGFLTVNEKFNSNLFFWFFEAQNNPSTAPLILWLQGGPGSSGFLGAFVEQGPFIVDSDMKLKNRTYSWNRNCNLLYIDSPVGSGYSYTKDDAGCARNEDDVAQDLYEGLQQFFTLFNHLRSNDFYITGESYAGHYVPAIAHRIFNEGKKANINLKGIAIGDGLIEPYLHMDYADHLYQIGLIDTEQADEMRQLETKAKQLIKDGEYREAFLIFDYMWHGEVPVRKPLFEILTGFNFRYNLLYTNRPADMDHWKKFVITKEVREALHVGDTPFLYLDAKTRAYLEADFMMSSTPQLIDLLNNDYKVLLFNGQFDLVCPPAFTERVALETQWKGQNEYKKKRRTVWKIKPDDEEVAGYIRRHENLMMIIVRNAGHILPYDQPRAAFHMIENFIFNKSFD